MPGGAIVAVGGGHGLARTLEALLFLGSAPTAVVTVADDGGSSGRLRQEHGIIALGDMRMALETLAGDAGLAELFGHRFADGNLSGHALGNLVLLALIERHGGDVVAAVDAAARLLGCQGRVVPCTAEDVTLVAQVDGAPVAGQVAVATTPGRHKAVWLEPTDPAACPVAVEAIETAEAVLLGPGSLYTSILPNLLVPGIAQALSRTSARLVYLANLSGQSGETGGMDLQDHVDVLCAHLPGDRSVVVVAHDGPEAHGSGKPLGLRLNSDRVSQVVTADLAARRPDGTPVAAHDPKALAHAVERVLV